MQPIASRHIAFLNAHESQLALELADIGVVAVDQVAVNVLFAGFTQVAVVFQQLDVLAFLASAIDSVRGVEILSAAIDTAVQLDIAVLDLPSEEINKRLNTVIQIHIKAVFAVLDSRGISRVCCH